MSNDDKRPVQLTWAEELAEEKRVEKVRTRFAIAVAVLGALLILILYWVRSSSGLAPGHDQALLAALVATAVVAGARALEGPDHNPQSRKRSSLPPASQMARSWLSCFIAVAAVFLLAQLISGIGLAPEKPSDAQAGTTISGTLTVKTGGQTERVTIAGQTEE